MDKVYIILFEQDEGADIIAARSSKQSAQRATRELNEGLPMGHCVRGNYSFDGVTVDDPDWAYRIGKDGFPKPKTKDWIGD